MDPLNRVLKGLAATGVMAVGLAMTAPKASAIDFVVDNNGLLTDAKGVQVGGSLFDVSFIDGTCISVFDGCDEQSDFTFDNLADAEAASQALFDQVFVVNPDNGDDYDLDAGVIAGCGLAGGCNIRNPYGLFDGGSFVKQYLTINIYAPSDSDTALDYLEEIDILNNASGGPIPYPITPGYDTGPGLVGATDVWVKWTPASTTSPPPPAKTPEPGALLGLGLTALVGAAAKRKLKDSKNV